jgi:hypothetical protein
VGRVILLQAESIAVIHVAWQGSILQGLWKGRGIRGTCSTLVPCLDEQMTQQITLLDNGPAASKESLVCSQPTGPSDSVVRVCTFILQRRGSGFGGLIRTYSYKVYDEIILSQFFSIQFGLGITKQALRELQVASHGYPTKANRGMEASKTLVFENIFPGNGGELGLVWWRK